MSRRHLAGFEFIPRRRRSLSDPEELQRRIVRCLESAFRAADRERWVASRPYRTERVKEALADLGREQGLRVCASGCHADEGEWLYDMSWFTYDRGEAGFFTSQPMVLESEWSPDPEIDGDLQKLVQARADVRVWVFAAGNADDFKAYVDRCRRRADLFGQSGDRYVCAAFDSSLA